jgi:hypothetical protein
METSRRVLLSAALVGVAMLATGGCGHGAGNARKPAADVASAAPTDGAAGAVGVLDDPSGEASGSSAPATVLRPGDRLTAGQTVRSPNGRYTLQQQPDGNLVLVDDAKRVQWSAQTYNYPGAYTNFDGDGDLVVHAKGGSAVWHSATVGQGAVLAVQDDGNAVVYRADHKALWTSRSERSRLYPSQSLLAQQLRRSADGRYTLVQYPDGNLVVTDAGNQVIWSSQTSGNPGAYARLGGDGNFVVYTKEQKPLWSSATSGNLGASVMVNADGNVVVVASSGKALWGTTTDGVGKLTVGQRLTAGQSRKSAHGGYLLAQQPDGNLVLRTAGGTPVWSSKTYGHAGAYTTLRSDGELVVYDAAGTPLWTPHVSGKGGTYLLVQDDGRAALYTAAKQVVWATPIA